MPDNTLQILIEAKDDASKVLSNVAGEARDLGGDLQDLAKKAILPVGAAFAGMTAIIGTSIKAYGESQQASARLSIALKNAGDSTDETRRKFEDYATELQNVTGYSDEAIVAAESLFTTYGNIGTNLIPKATKATTDLAAAMGIDLDSAAHAVGLALSSPEEGIGRLSKLLPAFKGELGDAIKELAKAGDTAGAQKLIFDELEKSVGGAGATMGQTLPGQIAIMKEKLNNLQETIGKALLDQVTAMVGGFDKFSGAIDNANNFLKQNDEVLKILAQGMIAFTVALGVVLVIIGVITGSALLLIGVIIALTAVLVAAAVTIVNVWESARVDLFEKMIAIHDFAIAMFQSITALILLEISKWQLAVFNAKTAIVLHFKGMYDGAVEWLGKIVTFFDNIINKAKQVASAIGGAITGGKLPGFQYGGYVDTTGLAMLHAGEFVVSKDMQSGRSPAPNEVNNNYSQPITINATTQAEPDWDALSYKLAFLLRNSR